MSQTLRCPTSVHHCQGCHNILFSQDEAYVEAGATIASRGDAFSQDITLKLRPPDIAGEVPQFREGTRCGAAPCASWGAAHTRCC